MGPNGTGHLRHFSLKSPIAHWSISAFSSLEKTEVKVYSLRHFPFQLYINTEGTHAYKKWHETLSKDFFDSSCYSWTENIHLLSAWAIGKSHENARPLAFNSLSSASAIGKSWERNKTKKAVSGYQVRICRIFLKWHESPCKKQKNLSQKWEGISSLEDAKSSAGSNWNRNRKPH